MSVARAEFSEPLDYLAVMYEANLVAGQEEAAKSALVESIRADAPDLVIMAAMRLQTNALFARIEAEKSAAKIIRAEFERPESII